MKIIYTLCLIIALSLAANALDKKMYENKTIYPASPEFIQSLNIELSKDFVSIPNSKFKSDAVLADEADTLTKYLERSTMFRIYGVNLSGQTLPLVGTNTIYYFAGQKFDLEPSQVNNYRLGGVLIPLAINVLAGTYQDTNLVWVYPTDGMGVPSGNPIATGALFLGDADSSSTTQIYTYTSVERTEEILPPNFLALFQTRNFNDSETDFVAIWANEQGDGQNESRSSILAWDTQNNRWVVANFSDLPINMADGNPPNFDVLILPVIEPLTGTDVDEPITVNDLTLESVYPNPIKGNGSIKFSVDVSTSLSIELVDMNGSLVKKILNNTVSAGQHSIDFNTTGLSSGTYMIVFRSAGSSFAIKTAIVK